jgi:hypothetical protein
MGAGQALNVLYGRRQTTGEPRIRTTPLVRGTSAW